MLYTIPELDAIDEMVLAGIYRRRDNLASAMRVPKRWPGLLRRNLMARAIRGSNSVEGYRVQTDDAAAAVDYEEALTADEQTFAEIRGYRQALGYVLTVARSGAAIDESTIKALHFMMLGHDLSKSPGQYRTGAIYVREEPTGDAVYEGPGSAMVPELMAELAGTLTSVADPIVAGAMAHLNLVMIQPFRDGDGRMARALQTLGASPGRPRRADLLQHRGMARRERRGLLPHPRAYRRRQLVPGSRRWTVAQVTEILYDALIGFRIRRHGYLVRAAIDERTASRDFKALTAAGLLAARSETRARHYVAGPRLLELRSTVREEVPRRIIDPYPDLRAELPRP
ncbi:Fic family protein [Nocardia brasiliensis]|uniref:Fic family protein n=1 Tax=Nocardia brasiliensis TaxID=37326 RepID=UPI001932B55A|nr:Fic family protein [Nocardia brasiliensis]